jgi:asparagine synthase (glutamine-hydrolysing)
MCGLVGVLSRRPSEREHLARANALLTHRGPDDSGEQWFDAGDYAGGLASRRLSIQDLSAAGHMPMASDDGLTWIAYNGEIYNFPELRERLVGEGASFRSSGDTEVILRAYERYGPDAVALLNGMFAIAIWDGRRRRLLLARDRFGIKPLYVHEGAGDLHFASEIKALLAFPSVPRQPDMVALDGAVTFMGVPGDRTGFQGIRRILPSHYLIWEDGRSQVQRYAQVDFTQEESTAVRPFGEAVTELRGVLERAVRRQMISDVPVGAFLSGGLDSSLLVALMARATTRPIRTYTITYRNEDQRWERGQSEARYARLVAERFGTDHQEIVVNPTVLDLLPKIVWHLDEPVGDPAAVSTLLISQAARSEAKVLLAGQGADEVFAGYHFYQAHRYADRYARLTGPVGSPLGAAIQGALLAASRLAPGSLAGRTLAVRRFADMVTRHARLSPGARHAAYHAYFTPADKARLYSPAFAAAITGHDAADHYAQLFTEASGRSTLNRLLYMDLRSHLPDLILNYGDKLGMAASIELRVPFLDHELVDFAARVPAAWKLHGGTGKHILREAARGLVPDEILARRKAPFGVPVRGWLRRDLVPLVDELLSEQSVTERGLFNYPAVRDTIRLSRRSLGTSAHQMWTLLTLELWFRIFIDRTMTP